MVDFFDITLTNLFTIGSVLTAVIIAAFSIRSSVTNARKENEKQIESKMEAKTNEIKLHVNEKINEVRYRFSQNERDIKDSQDDIEDIEKEIKQMNTDLRSVCTKLSKYDYVVEDLIPDFKKLKGQFYEFKNAVDKIPTKPSNIVSNNTDVSEDMK